MEIVLVVSILIASATSYPQRPAEGSPVVADARDVHIIKQVSPIYPPIAKAAHISGQVKLQIEIDASGRVVNAKAISGPAMLFSSAEECVKQWTFEPLINNSKPVPASRVVAVNFELPSPKNPNDEQIASRFFPLDQACIKAVSSNVDPTQQADACKQAASVALEFSTEERFIERRSAFVYASTAFLRNKQFKEALDYANKAVYVVGQGHDDGSGSSAAYSVRAQAQAQLGNLQEASNDLTKAEDFERDAITKMGGLDGDFVKHQYLPALRGILNFHAQVLTALGKTNEAESKRAEAARL